MGAHKDSTDVHVPYAWSYADEAARTGASGFVAGDVGKMALQEDDNSLWTLIATTPTWVPVGGGGDASGPGSSTDNAIARFDGTGGKTLQDSGITIDDSNNMVGNGGSLSGFGGAINTQTGTTYTTQDSDHGKVIILNNASAITLTIHQAAPAGFNCLIIQLGAGQVTVAAGGTGNVRNYDSHTKLAGQYAMGSIFVVSNAGTAPEIYLAGNTGA